MSASAPPTEEQPQGQFAQAPPTEEQPQGQFAQNAPGQPPVPPNAPGVYQPGSGPGVPANCPPGLEYLTQIDQLLVQQQVELLEAFVGFETSNKYVVKNTLGQQVYFAAEDTNCCTRNCCGNKRCFDMKILDNKKKKEVIHLIRDLRCSTCWCPCFMQKMEVQAPIGTTIGYVCQTWSPCYPKFAIKDAKENVILRIEGPLCTCNCCGDVEFDVMSEDGSAKVGKISKQWTGLIKEHFTDADNFGINFPMDLDVNVKATLMGACFLIDFMYFERDEKKSKGDYVGV
ncbi:phospholipid scramblase 1-like isoform X2 [Amphiura filiformis]|uniref:phospholipid scramblase 1-like isoform X2 n=1 Tax=Amphiura filiformis TaxID=82378 RepID=UPI003B21C723